MIEVERVHQTFYIISEGDVALWVAIEPTWKDDHPLAWVVQHEETEICSCFELEAAIAIAKEIVARGVISMGE